MPNQKADPRIGKEADSEIGLFACVKSAVLLIS